MSKREHHLKSHTRRVFFVVAALGVVAVLAVAGCRGHRHAWMTPERVEKMITWHLDDKLDDLDADDGQRAKVHAIKDRLLGEARAFHESSGDVKPALVDAWDQETPDAAKMHALVDERVEALRALLHEGVDASVELHAILTPEQRKVLLEDVREHLAKR